MIKKQTFICAVLMFMMSCMYADSVFSALGFPILRNGVDTYAQGMGSAGISDQYRFNSSFYNPALMTTGSKVYFSTGVKAGYTTFKDNAEEQNTYKSEGLYFPYFNIMIPYKSHRFGFQATAFAAGNLETVTKDKTVSFTDTEIDSTETFSYDQKNVTDNYIYKLDLMYAFKNEMVNFGFGTNIYLGHQEQEIQTSMESLLSPSYNIEKQYRGYGFSLSLAKQWQKFAAAFVYHSQASLEGDVIVNFVVEDYITIDDMKTDLELPNRFSFGTTYRVNKYFKTNFDIHYDFWKETNMMNSRNTAALNFGIAYDPVRGFGEWYEKIPVRAGLHFKQLPIKNNDTDINEYGASFGFGVPLKSIYKSLDFSIDYTKRGNASDTFAEDNEIMFSIGITGFDIFKKRKRLTDHRMIPKADKKDW